MAISVKDEVFGTRNSFLEKIFQENKINYTSNIWFITARAEFNKNPQTRYLVFREFFSLSELNNSNSGSFIKVEMMNRYYGIFFNEKENLVVCKSYKNLEQKTFTYKEFENFILTKTETKLQNDPKTPSNNVSPFGKFFKRFMGKGFTLTDIDFLLFKNGYFFIEEKKYIKNNKGYLGIGQAISFKELYLDIIDKNTKFLFIFSDGKDFYIHNFLGNISIYLKEQIDGWGNMFGINLEKKYDKQGIISLFK